MRLVEITGIALEASTGAPLVVLQETDEPHRTMPIFIGGSEAASIGLALAGETADRPLTHDVMAELVELLHARVDRVDVTELHDGAFLAEMTVSGPGGDQRLDTRPSDAIALALRLDAPLYVSDELLEEAGSIFELTSADETSGDSSCSTTPSCSTTTPSTPPSPRSAPSSTTSIPRRSTPVRTPSRATNRTTSRAGATPADAAWLRRARSNGPASLVWLIGAANGDFGRGGRYPSSWLWSWFGVSDCAGRASTIHRAAGLGADDDHGWFDPAGIGDPALLHSVTRAGIADQRDHMLDVAERRRTWSVRGSDGRSVRIDVRAQPTKVVHSTKAVLRDSGRAVVLVGFGEHLDDAEFMSLSIPDAHDLVRQVQAALDTALPTTGVREIAPW